MPISERLRRTAGPRLALAAALLLAACDPALLGGPAPKQTTVTVAGRSVRVAAPPGFCVDSGSTRVSADGAFVLMSDCTLISGGPGSPATIPAAITASISTGGLGADPDAALRDLQRFADTAEGRAVLGLSGRSDRVRILSSDLNDGVLYVLVEDAGPKPLAGVDRRFWRAFFEANGRLTALSLLGFEGSGLSSQTGLNQIAAGAATIRAANGG